METKQLIGRSFKATPASRITLPCFAVVSGNIVADTTPVHTRSATVQRKLSISAAIVAPQGHAVSIALRTMVARRALVASL